jgi:histone acetyltransferase (RNA polymerase elongator complex component)
VTYILNKKPLSKQDFDLYYREASKIYHRVIKKSDILYMYKTICKEKNEPECEPMNGFFQSKPHRSQSGVMVYAIFTHPFWKSGTNGTMKAFSCKYDCTYCPDNQDDHVHMLTENLD